MRPRHLVGAVVGGLLLMWGGLGCSSVTSLPQLPFFGQQQTATKESFRPPGAGGTRAALVVSVAPAQRGNIAADYTYPAAIQVGQQVNLVPKTTGRIEKYLVDVGDEVKTGDVLVQLESVALEAAVKQAEANLLSAQARLATMRAGGRPEEIAAAEAQLMAARARLNQVKNGPTQAELQAAASAVAAAQTAYDKAIADLARVKNPTPEELASVSAQLEKARVALQKAQADYDRVSWRGDVAALPQAVALEQATADYQAALAAYQLRVNPKPEDLQAAERAVASAKAALDSAVAKYEQLKAGPTAEDLAIAQAAVIQAEQTLALKKAPYTERDIQAAEAAVAQAQAQLDAAKANLLESRIVAPFDGIVSARLLAEGALAGPSTPALTLVSKRIEMTVNVEEARLPLFAVGQPVEISVPSYPGRKFSGKIVGISPTADPKSHTFTVKVVPDDHGGALRGGMFAEVRIRTAEKSNAVLIPKEAVFQKGNKALVYVVRDGKALAREVTGGISDGTFVEAPEGIEPGDQVVIAGQASLNDGDPVRIAGRVDEGLPGPQTEQRPSQAKPEGGQGMPPAPGGDRQFGGKPPTPGGQRPSATPGAGR